MTKLFLLSLAVVSTTAFTIINTDKENTAVTEQNTVIHLESKPQPVSSVDYSPCTRNFSPGLLASNSYKDDSFESPKHCQEPNCGLGVYATQVGSEEKRCSYCNALEKN